MLLDILLKFFYVFQFVCLVALLQNFFDDGLLKAFNDFLLGYNVDVTAGVTVTEITCFFELIFFDAYNLLLSFLMC